MKVIIAGSRTITDGRKIFLAIKDSDFTITEVVCGGARGVDELGKQWAIHNNIPVKIFPADWTTHGRAAGPIRNAVMAKYADALILVWDGKSRGSKNMKSQAKKNNLLIYEAIYPCTS